MKFPTTVHPSRLERDLDELFKRVQKRRFTPRELSAHKKLMVKQPTPTGYR